MKYKCKICDQEESTKGAIRQHIKEKHVEKINNTKKHSEWYYVIGGIFGGISISYILIHALIYLFIIWLFGGYPPSYNALDTAVFLIAAIYAIIFVKILSYSRDKQSEGLKWFGIGGFGLLLGLFINWIVWRADKKSMAVKYVVFLIAWLLSTFVAFFILMIY